MKEASEVRYTGVKLFIGSKVLCVFCFETCTPEGRGGEEGGSANFETKDTEQKVSKSAAVRPSCNRIKPIFKRLCKLSRIV